MKRHFYEIAILSTFALCSPLYAGQSICPDGFNGVSSYSASSESEPGCLYFDPGFNTTQTEYDRIMVLFKIVPQQHIKIVNNSPEEMTTAEKTAVNNAMATAQTLAIRTGAKNQLSGFADGPLFQRAVADILKDEINTLRAWTVSFKTEVAAASNLADLKTRVSTLSTLNPRTLSQLKTAIHNRADDGSVDS